MAILVCINISTHFRISKVAIVYNYNKAALRKRLGFKGKM